MAGMTNLRIERIAVHTAMFGTSYTTALHQAYASGQAAVPEPTSLGLLGIAGVLSLRRARRSAKDSGG